MPGYCPKLDGLKCQYGATDPAAVQSSFHGVFARQNVARRNISKICLAEQRFPSHAP